LQRNGGRFDSMRSLAFRNGPGHLAGPIVLPWLRKEHQINRSTVLLLGSCLLLSSGCVACSASSATLVPASPVAAAPTLVSSGSQSPAPPTVDPCKLLSSADILIAFGGQVGTSQLDLTNTAIPTCTWAVTDSKIGTGTLRLAVTGLNGTSTTFTSMQKSFAGATSISGVGQQAFAVDSIGQVVVYAQGTTLTAAASGFVLDGADPPRAATRSALTAISKTAASKL
jgi:hypothetical protein